VSISRASKSADGKRQRRDPPPPLRARTSLAHAGHHARLPRRGEDGVGQADAIQLSEGAARATEIGGEGVGSMVQEQGHDRQRPRGGSPAFRGQDARVRRVCPPIAQIGTDGTERFAG
jgi:hypothetical protein